MLRPVARFVTTLELDPCVVAKQTVLSLKFLGVGINSCLSWKPQIKELLSRLGSSIFLLEHCHMWLVFKP